MTPKAASRLAREASVQSFDRAAEALSEDWGVSLDGKQLQRWSERMGRDVVRRRDAEVVDSECGRPPGSAANGGELLVIEMDGGRVQMREKDAETGNRWREDKVGVVTTYLKGDGAERKAKPLVTTHVATMEGADRFGRMLRVEAERRGLGRAAEVVVIGDGGNWIDPVAEREFPGRRRIVDWYHAAEHLYDCGRALHGPESPKAKALAERLKGRLWDGGVDAVAAELRGKSRALGPPGPDDGDDHPRRVLANNAGYFERHAGHMQYDEYRRRGWPVGSGVVEGAVKQVNKRVKGSEMFWIEEGVEPILALRALWLSDDDRWAAYWRTRPAYRTAHRTAA